MNRKTTILGLLSGLICALAVFVFTGEVQAQADSERAEALERFGGEQVQACVATTDIAAGETLNTTNVAEKAWIADLLPENPVAYADAIGRQVTSPAVAGEVVCEMRFEQGADSVNVPEGLSAVSLPAEEVNAVGGAVERGMKVDIYLANSETAKPLANGVLVLSTSAGASSSLGGGVSWVTVAVESERVQEFVSAASRGNLYFAIPGQKKGANDA